MVSKVVTYACQQSIKKTTWFTGVETVRLDFLSENEKLKLSFIFSTMFSLILNLGFAVCLCQREEGSRLISFNERFSENSSQLFDYFIKHTDVYTI